MKLKTKFQDEDFDLGEVIEANIYHSGSGGVKVIAEAARGGIVTFYFRTLKEINEMFEDYEEPKIPYSINWFGEVSELSGHLSDIEIEKLRGVGNYFETKEEAEKAVERLRAWKRLRDKGFRFDHVGKYENLCGNGFEIPITATMPPERYNNKAVAEDLNTLFGGEE